MRAREAHETAVDIMRHNIVRMSNRELTLAEIKYLSPKNAEDKKILKAIRDEQKKRGIY